MDLKSFDSLEGVWIDIPAENGASLEFNDVSGWVTSVGYKKYIAQITQNGTDVPEVIVHENTLGFNPDWYYDKEGSYGFDWKDDFYSEKCINYISQDYSNGNITYIIYEDSYDITLKSSKGDGYIKQQTFEIRYYN